MDEGTITAGLVAAALIGLQLLAILGVNLSKNTEAIVTTAVVGAAGIVAPHIVAWRTRYARVISAAFAIALAALGFYFTHSARLSDTVEATILSLLTAVAALFLVKTA